jgi:hypothetical protein
MMEPPTPIPPGVNPETSQLKNQGVVDGAGSAQTLNRSDVEQNPAAVGNQPSQNSENPAPGTGFPTGQSPGPAPTPLAPNPADIAWCLLAQLAVYDANANAVLMGNASNNVVPPEAWPAIATTLVNEALQDGVLVTIDSTTLASSAVLEGHQRLDLIESLLKVAPESAAKALRDEVVRLSQQLSDQHKP